MAIGDQAPYAPTDAVVRVLETYRDTGLGGGPINNTVLARMGMGDEICRRVLMSLRLLDLIDDEGKATTNLLAFKQATSEKYKEVLADQLYDVYAPVFAVTGTDLNSRTTAQVEDAFRTFKPDSLRKRMVTLFLGLCQYVGIMNEPAKAKPGPKSGGAARKTTNGGALKAAAQRRLLREDQDKPPPPPAALDPARQRYLELLISKAEAQDEPDPELLDRIERALGIAPASHSEAS
jgi:hypothetical protein